MKADYTNAEGDENFVNTKVATTPININIKLACSIVPHCPYLDFHNLCEKPKQHNKPIQYILSDK